MATTTTHLTWEQFQEQYGNDKRYEYWYGEARRTGMPKGIHGLLQKIVMFLLDEAGYESGSEVELRIEAEAHPRPDVIATGGAFPEDYPTKAVEVVVEIVSPGDSWTEIKEKCRKYEQWGFEGIYLIDASDRSVERWQGGLLRPVADLAGVPTEKVWAELDLRLRAKRS